MTRSSSFPFLRSMRRLQRPFGLGDTCAWWRCGVDRARLILKELQEEGLIKPDSGGGFILSAEGEVFCYE